MSVADHFTSLGMAADDAVSRAALVAKAETCFAQAFGAPARWRWFVPGRLEVFGKHTDYAGGRVLVSAVPRGFAVAAAPRADQRVVVVDVRDGRHAEIDPLDERLRAGWMSYLQVVVRRFAANFPGASLGTNLALHSDLPSAAGLSSSSALVVGVATAISTRARLAERAEWQQSIQRVEDLASYFGCVENGSGFGTLSGAAGVGTLGGSEDHMAILGCRPGQVSEYRFLPTVPLGHTVLPAHWVFVVAASGVHAAKAGSARDRFNRASLACRALLDCWNRGADRPAPSLAAALSPPGALEALTVRATSAPPDGFSADELQRRLAHFVAEDRRVPQAAAACRAADRAAMTRLTEGSQLDADTLLGNQVPETAALAALARACGAFAATSFGAGFGGSVWALVDRHDVDGVVRDWKAAYASRFPAGARWQSFIARPGPAVTAIPIVDG